MRQKIIGHFHFGFENVQLVAREGTGGEYYTQPEKETVARIKVGIGYQYWDEVVTVLLHECFEFATDRIQARYRSTQNQGNDHAGYLFVFNHPQFSDTCAKVAEFITPALPLLSTAWKKYHKAWRRP